MVEPLGIVEHPELLLNFENDPEFICTSQMALFTHFGVETLAIQIWSASQRWLNNFEICILIANWLMRSVDADELIRT